ncbi:MAG: hypothetical protein AB3X44_13030 [Leptothrix sp. (in: b-proteobacteria)]
MRLFKSLGLLLCAGWLAGCDGGLGAARLWMPEQFGLTPVSAHLYIEQGADAATREALKVAAEQAEAAVVATYGAAIARPSVHVCVTEVCYARFGGNGAVAKVYGDRILLSPRGLNWHFMAHEWSHAEVQARLSWRAWWLLPRWFDEGLAVAVSDAPEHSESHWQWLVLQHVEHPSRAELQTFVSLRQWLDAVRRYGDDRNTERRTKGEPLQNPLYAAAGHEVRPWLAETGPAGLRHFIAQLNAGEDFSAAYRGAAPNQHPDE